MGSATRSMRMIRCSVDFIVQNRVQPAMGGRAAGLGGTLINQTERFRSLENSLSSGHIGKALDNSATFEFLANYPPCLTEIPSCRQEHCQA